MKKGTPMRIGILLLLSTSLALESHAQSITYTNLYIPGYLQTASLVVGTGQLAKVVGGNAGYGYNQFNVTVGTNTFSGAFLTSLPVVAGPATISVVALRDGAISEGFWTIELDNPSQPITSTPSTAVVIPADSGGPVNIVLESSVDLITWNAALPGTYGTSTTNRFFRVRAVRQ
jgi:hypothetical protein